jgi:hypothetical protein
MSDKISYMTKYDIIAVLSYLCDKRKQSPARSARDLLEYNLDINNPDKIYIVIDNIRVYIRQDDNAVYEIPKNEEYSKASSHSLGL